MNVRSDIFYLYCARAVRGFGDGFAVIILPVYLSAIGFSPSRLALSLPLRCWVSGDDADGRVSRPAL